MALSQTHTQVSMLHLAVMWVPGMGSRAQRLALLLRSKDEDILGVREFDLNHEAPTGLFEDSQVVCVCERERGGRGEREGV